MNPEAITVIKQELARFHCAAIYLFGSAARDALREDSDLDIAFLPRTRGCDPVAVFESAQHLAQALRREVDLVDLSTASTVMRKEITARGVLLAETHRAARQEFEMYALSDYARLNEERAPVLRALGATA